MSQNERELASAGDDSPNKKEPVQEAVELTPVVFFDKGTRQQTAQEEQDNLYDFRPKVVDSKAAEASAPKASSAQESAPSSESVTEPETDSKPDMETTASVEKDSTPSKESESGTQTSSNKTSNGKKEQTAKE